jgi:hypothetical protein
MRAEITVVNRRRRVDADRFDPASQGLIPTIDGSNDQPKTIAGSELRDKYSSLLPKCACCVLPANRGESGEGGIRTLETA